MLRCVPGIYCMWCLLLAVALVFSFSFSFGQETNVHNQFTFSYSRVVLGLYARVFPMFQKHILSPEWRGDPNIYNRLCTTTCLGRTFDSSMSCEESGAESDGWRDDLLAEGRGVAAGEATVDFEVGARDV